jgi:hypothetical protein
MADDLEFHELRLTKTSEISILYFLIGEVSYLVILQTYGEKNKIE